jgi:4-hydroxythreonine-4-phosphate dehydrogenase
MAVRLIGITTGDHNSVGLEVTMKALSSLPNSSSRYLIIRGPDQKKICWPTLPKKLTLRVNNLDDALSEAKSSKSPFRYLEVISGDNPAQWVEAMALLCLKGDINGMVTGPVSKKTFIDANLSSIGHTPLLQKVCSTPEAYMGFLGSRFNVVLLTGHVPTIEVEKLLTSKLVNSALQTILAWKQGLPLAIRKKPLGVLGLNPHCGEGGLIGLFEKNNLIPIISKNKNVIGPLVPDAAFSEENWKKYSFFVTMYHDQGLIPFKMIHGHNGGAHVTIGLPIIRTSVDHGTATELNGKGIARPDSMAEALRWCNYLISKKG